MVKEIRLVSKLEEPRRAEWSVRATRRQFPAAGGRHIEVYHSNLDSCMLGLRPRLVTRPSLIDIVNRRDSDRATVLSPVEQDSPSVDLPQSPIADSSTNTTTTTAMAPSRDVESQQGESSVSFLTKLESS
jgi:hypothetical protein